MKVGCKGVYITRTCYHDDSDGVLRGTLKLRDCMPMKDVLKVMHLVQNHMSVKVLNKPNSSQLSAV